MDIAGELCCTSKTTAWRSIHRVMNALVHISPRYIKYPQNLNRISALFQRTCGFPDVIGCIDGTHIPILVPMNDRSETFRCRKGYFSLNVQMICGPDCTVYSVDSRWPGSAHDATIWSTSQIKQDLSSTIPDKYHLLGDSAYLLSKTVLTPFKLPSSVFEARYNKKHSATRMHIERTYGQIKRRFPLLVNGLRFKCVKDSAKCIVAIAVLHNICKKSLEYDPETIGSDDTMGSEKRNRIAAIL